MAKKDTGDKSPIKPKPMPIVISSVGVGRKNIRIGWEQGDASFDLCERDNPLPSFYHAFEALTPLVATICHFPPKWVENGVRVVGLRIGEQSGAQSVALVVRKDIDDAAKEFAFVTPSRLLAHPETPGKYTSPLSEKDAGLVYEAIEQAKAYVKGDRAQGQIAFEDEDGDGDDGGEELPIEA